MTDDQYCEFGSEAFSVMMPKQEQDQFLSNKMPRYWIPVAGSPEYDKQFTYRRLRTLCTPAQLLFLDKLKAKGGDAKCNAPDTVGHTVEKVALCVPAEVLRSNAVADDNANPATALPVFSLPSYGEVDNLFLVDWEAYRKDLFNHASMLKTREEAAMFCARRAWHSAYALGFSKAKDGDK